MASSRRWNQALFPITDSLIERLFDDDEDRDQDAHEDDQGVDIAGDTTTTLVWYLEEASDDDAGEDGLLYEDETQALNMRVLEDYLRRRMIEDPEQVMPTLH